MMTTLAWLLGQLFLRNTKTFWGQDVMKGSRKKLKILISSRHGSWVWHYCEYFERQFENAFFQVESAQTQEPGQKYFFEAKISIEVSKVSKQLQDKKTEEDVTIYSK